MEMASAWSIAHDSNVAINEAYSMLRTKLNKQANLIFLYCSAEYDVEEILMEINKLSPDSVIQGGTSCHGVMTEEGFHYDKGFGLGLLGIYDPDGQYGVGSVEISNDAKFAAKTAIGHALEKCDRMGQVPAMVWMTAAPGYEEEIIKGIEEVVGSNVPITGGSSADNTVSGDWKQIANRQVHANAVVITVMFPSINVMFAFHSGYEPTEKVGIVTQASGRLVRQIDYKPAAEVYNEWSGGMISEYLGVGGNILATTSLHPLGRVVGNVSGVPYYQLAHPDTVTDGDALSLFANIEEGEHLVFMSGTKDGLVSRAGRVAKASLAVHSTLADQINGSLVVYCAGCMLTVEDRMESVVEGLNDTLKDKPFLGLFTFGEQGCFVGGENRHGNLMISVLTFSQ